MHKKGLCLLTAWMILLLMATLSLAAPVAPGSIIVPLKDSDGSYVVKWGASATVGVTYTLQEATDSTFASPRVISAGTALQAAITGRTPWKTYYYRVRASSSSVSSSWKFAANGCKVGQVTPPATLTVPANDADGSFTVKWTASPTTGVTTYIVQEAADTAFTMNLREVYRGPNLSVPTTVATPPLKTYFYRVKAVRPGFVDSNWKVATGCKVGKPEPVGSLTVPASDADGIYVVEWSASTTPDVTYTLEEATNSAFSTGLRTAYRGSALQTNITGRTNGSYFYRVKVDKSGFVSSTWKTKNIGCVVPYALSDLNGNWSSIGLKTPRKNTFDSANFGYDVDKLVINNGAVTLTTLATSDLAGTETWTETIDSNGRINVGDPNTYIYLNAAKNVIVSLWTDPESGEQQMGVDVKRAASYTLSDLNGTWYSIGLKTPRKNTSDPANFGYDVDKQIINNGAVTLTTLATSDSAGTETWTETIDSNGRINVGDPNTYIYLNAGKDVIVSLWTDPVTGEQQIGVAVKKAASYSLSDLNGTWYSIGLKTPRKNTSDPANFGYDVDKLVINNGAVTLTTLATSDLAGTETWAETIDSNGRINVGDPNTYIYLNAGKNVIVSLWTDPETGEQQMGVNIKRDTP